MPPAISLGQRAAAGERAARWRRRQAVTVPAASADVVRVTVTSQHPVPVPAPVKPCLPWYRSSSCPAWSCPAWSCPASCRRAAVPVVVPCRLSCPCRCRSSQRTAHSYRCCPRYPHSYGRCPRYPHSYRRCPLLPRSSRRRRWRHPSCHRQLHPCCRRSYPYRRCRCPGAVGARAVGRARATDLSAVPLQVPLAPEAPALTALPALVEGLLNAVLGLTALAAVAADLVGVLVVLRAKGDRGRQACIVVVTRRTGRLSSCRTRSCRTRASPATPVPPAVLVTWPLLSSLFLPSDFAPSDFAPSDFAPGLRALGLRALGLRALGLRALGLRVVTAVTRVTGLNLVTAVRAHRTTDHRATPPSSANAGVARTPPTIQAVTNATNAIAIREAVERRGASSSSASPRAPSWKWSVVPCRDSRSSSGTDGDHFGRHAHQPGRKGTLPRVT